MYLSKKNRILGAGTFVRDEGRLPPSFRNILSKIGQDKINSLVLFRTPISVSNLLNILSAGEYQKILQKQGYDNAFHLALLINGHYVLDKQAVLHLEAGSIPASAETLEVPVGNSDISIQELVDNTKKKMGDKLFTSYNAKNNNCQNFILSVLQANGLNNPEATSFIKQDSQQIFEQLPKYAEIITNVVTATAAVAYG